MPWTRTYLAYCTHPNCGWVGGTQTSEQAALDDGDDHALAIADDRNITDHHETVVVSGAKETN